MPEHLNQITLETRIALLYDQTIGRNSPLSDSDEQMLDSIIRDFVRSNQYDFKPFDPFLSKHTYLVRRQAFAQLYLELIAAKKPLKADRLFNNYFPNLVEPANKSTDEYLVSDTLKSLILGELRYRPSKALELANSQFIKSPKYKADLFLIIFHHAFHSEIKQTALDEVYWLIASTDDTDVQDQLKQRLATTFADFDLSRSLQETANIKNPESRLSTYMTILNAKGIPFIKTRAKMDIINKILDLAIDTYEQIEDKKELRNNLIHLSPYVFRLKPNVILRNGWVLNFKLNNHIQWTDETLDRIKKLSENDIRLLSMIFDGTQTNPEDSRFRNLDDTLKRLKFPADILALTRTGLSKTEAIIQKLLSSDPVIVAEGRRQFNQLDYYQQREVNQKLRQY